MCGGEKAENKQLLISIPRSFFFFNSKLYESYVVTNDLFHLVLLDYYRLG